MLSTTLLSLLFYNEVICPNDADGKADSVDLDSGAVWPQGYKINFMLNSAEHEILNAHKYKNIKTLSIFQAQNKP